MEIISQVMAYLWMQGYIEYIQLFNFFAPSFIFLMACYLCVKIHRPIIFSPSRIKKKVRKAYRFVTKRSKN